MHRPIGQVCRNDEAEAGLLGSGDSRWNRPQFTDVLRCAASQLLKESSLPKAEFATRTIPSHAIIPHHRRNHAPVIQLPSLFLHTLFTTSPSPSIIPIIIILPNCKCPYNQISGSDAYQTIHHRPPRLPPTPHLNASPSLPALPSEPTSTLQIHRCIKSKEVSPDCTDSRSHRVSERDLASVPLRILPTGEYHHASFTCSQRSDRQV